MEAAEQDNFRQRLTDWLGSVGIERDRIKSLRSEDWEDIVWRENVGMEIIDIFGYSLRAVFYPAWFEAIGADIRKRKNQAVGSC